MSSDPDSQDRSSATVAARLAEAIHDHRLIPGMKLNEDEVGVIYGVSRTVVRAALQELAHNHLVELRRNRGAFVAQPSVKEAREVFEGEAPRLQVPGEGGVGAAWAMGHHGAQGVEEGVGGEGSRVTLHGCTLAHRRWVFQCSLGTHATLSLSGV